MNQNVSATFFGFVAGILGMLTLKQFAEKWGNSSAEEAAPLSGVQTLPLAAGPFRLTPNSANRSS